MKAVTKRHIRDGLIGEIVFLKEQRELFIEWAAMDEIYDDTVLLLTDKLRKRYNELEELIRE
jgi:hypothetical protein